MSRDGDGIGNEFTGPLPLLQSLCQNEFELESYGCYDQQILPGGQNGQGQLVRPAVRYRETPWDRLPREMDRPSAVSTISDIAILARRLGMSWDVFNPEGGCTKAVGNGHGIFSTFTRSVGLQLQSVHLGGGVAFVDRSASPNVGRVSKAELYIPTREADMMGLGILPGCISLNIPNMKLGTTAEVYATMDILDSTRKASSTLRDVNRLLVGKWDAHCMYAFSDIIALAAPIIRRRHSTIVRLPMLTEFCSNLLSQRECFVVFHNRLKEYTATHSSEQANWVLKHYEQLKSKYNEWENEAEHNSPVNGSDLGFLEEVHDCWDAATEYFVRMEEQQDLRYLDLMAAHIAHAVNYWGNAWRRLKQEIARDNYGLRALEAEGSHLYFDYSSLIVEDMRKKGFEGPEKVVHDAWFMLMFRAFCWWRCHSLHPGEDPSHKGSPLPSRYWDCKMPVYIG